MKQTTRQLLLWSQRYTKTDMLYLSKNGFWLTTAKILSGIASLISSVAFANLLPEETYGMFRYVLSVATLLAIPTLHGIEIALTRAVAQGVEGDVKLALRTRLRWGVLGSIASLLLAGYYFFMGNSILCTSFLIVAVFAPMMDSFHLYASILNGKKKFNLMARDEVVTRFAVALLLAALVFFTDSILLILLTFFFTTTFLRFLFLRHALLTETYNDRSDPSLINYGKHLTAVGIFGRVSAQADKILIFQQVGGTALAAFYLALIPMKLTQNVLSGLSTLAFPKFSNAPLGALRKTLPAKIAPLYVLIIAIVGIYIALAPFFYSVFFPLYPESVFMSQLFFLQLLFFPVSLFSTAITAAGEKKKLYINSTVYGVLRIALLLVLVPTYGVFGAIASILIMNVVLAFTTIFLFYR